MPEISVIVVNWNGKHFLPTCLQALRQQSFSDFETILVDNCSNDGSAQYVRTEFPEVRLITLTENRGFTGANIAGYEQSRGDLIGLLNNDTEVHPCWLEEIYRASLMFPDAGSFASKMLMFDQRERIDNCGFALTRAGLTLDLGRGEEEKHGGVVAQPVFGACAGAAVYRRNMLADVGFLDDDFFMTYEDVDLAFRAQLKRYKCMFIPSALVFHRYRATMRDYPARQVYFSQRNIELVYLKNMPLGLLFGSFIPRFLYVMGGAIYFFRKKTGPAFLRAKLDVMRHLPSILRKRRAIQSARTVSNKEFRATMQGRGWLLAKWKKVCSAWLGSTKLKASRSVS